MDEPQHKKKKNERGETGEKLAKGERDRDPFGRALRVGGGDPQKDGRRKMYQLKMQLRFQ